MIFLHFYGDMVASHDGHSGNRCAQSFILNSSKMNITNESGQNKEETFTIEQIEDVKVIIKANGKNYSMKAKGDREEARMMRIAMSTVLFDSHVIVTPSLEEIKQLH